MVPKSFEPETTFRANDIYLPCIRRNHLIEGDGRKSEQTCLSSPQCVAYGGHLENGSTQTVVMMMNGYENWMTLDVSPPQIIIRIGCEVEVISAELFYIS